MVRHQRDEGDRGTEASASGEERPRRRRKGDLKLATITIFRVRLLQRDARIRAHHVRGVVVHIAV